MSTPFLPPSFCLSQAAPIIAESTIITYILFFVPHIDVTGLAEKETVAQTYVLDKHSFMHLARFLFFLSFF